MTNKSEPNRRLLGPLLFVLTLSTDWPPGCAFNIASVSNRHPWKVENRIQRREETVCFARKIRKLTFDLEQIEAFEKSLDEEKGKIDNLDQDEEVIDENDLLEEDWLNIEIPAEFNNARIDLALDALLQSDLSRSQVAEVIKEGRVFLSSSPDDKLEPIHRMSFKVQSGQRVLLSKSCLNRNAQPTDIIAENIPLDILYEDEYMIVVNKAAGMVVHPAAGNWNGTLVNALAYYLTNESPYGAGEFVDLSHEGKEEIINGITGENTISFRPGIVHRLDKGKAKVWLSVKENYSAGKVSHALHC